MLLIYTKNLDIVYYNCQKSYIYYIEFIGQIGEDNHSFLQLNSKDAALFVYKKTIFEINNDIRTNYTCDNISDKLLTELNNFMEIYNTILFKLIEEKTLINLITITSTDLYTIMNKIIKIYIDPNYINADNKIAAINTFVSHFKNCTHLEYLESFIKKIKKLDKIDIYKLETQLLNNDNVNCTPIKFINMLIQHI